jgi:hypothetical protein
VSKASDIERTFGRKHQYATTVGAWWSREIDQLQDDDLWRRYLRRHGIRAAQVRYLEQWFETSDEGLDAAHGRWDRGEPEWVWTVRLREWILDVLAIEVEHKPGGRSVLRAPDPPEGMEIYAPYRVEIRWAYDPDAARARPFEVRVIADEYLEERSAVPKGIEKYFLAFWLTSDREPPERLPRRRPAAGKPLETDFYTRVLGQYNALKLQGHKAPAAELARRMGENPSTVKSWLRRGRKYLEGGNGGAD